MTTKALILTIAPELSTMPDATINQIIADSALLVSSAVYGSLYELAQRYLCAHLLALVNQSSSGGINSDLTTNVSEQAGRVSVTKSKISSLSDIPNATRYDLTKYGVVFMQLSRSRSGSAGFVVV